MQPADDGLLNAQSRPVIANTNCGGRRADSLELIVRIVII
jgi:hypothetical protein